MPQLGLAISEAMRSSVRDWPRYRYSGPARGRLLLTAIAADEAPVWWSNERDAFLRTFWKGEPFLASAIYSLCARNAGFRWEITGDDKSKNEASTQLLRTSEFGKSWQHLILKVSEDLYTQDNGAFAEVIRPARAKLAGRIYPAFAKRHKASGDIDWYAVINRFGESRKVDANDVDDSPADLPIALAHLDAGKCTRTGDPDRPVIYQDRFGAFHELMSWQVLSLADMPSPIEEMHEVGFCLVSRVFRSAQTVRDFIIFREEKISGRFARAVHLTNISADAISDAIAQAGAHADERGLTRYSQPIIADTLDPSGRPYHTTIPLAELPEGWNEDEMMRWYVGLIALAAGEHYSFFAPMPGRRLGSAREVEVQERQARGKSSRLFMDMITDMFSNAAVFPPECTFTFKHKDPDEQKQKDDGAKIRAQTRKDRIDSGEITPAIARQIAVDEGDLKEKYLTELNEADLTPEDTERTPGDESEEVAAQPAEDFGEGPVETEEKQDEDDEGSVEITPEDIARAIGKWDERVPEAAGILQARKLEED